MNMPAFDKFKTGQINPESGLYLCTNCNEIIPLSKGERFPPCTDCGSATWMMVAVAGEAGKTYDIGKNSPQSGLFLCTNCKKQIIPISKGDNFPPCRLCEKQTKWQLIVSA
jgi:DNA-directed RNA polymerase subunit RPC12/RpoP